MEEPHPNYSAMTVNEIIAEAFPVSVELGLLALMWALIIGITALVIMKLALLNRGVRRHRYSI